MQAYKTYAHVDSMGKLTLGDLPFDPGTLVEVLVCDAELSNAERAKAKDEAVQLKKDAARATAATAGIAPSPPKAAVREDDIEARLEAMRGAKPV